MVDLSTTYMGLPLRTPLVPSAAQPLSKDVDRVKALEDAGASAVCMYSLFEEQIDHESFELDHYLVRSSHSYAEALTYFPDLDDFQHAPDLYLKHLAKLKRTVRIPIIASLNGVSMGGWTKYAKRMEEAGADAIEINLYYVPANPDVSGRDVESIYVDVLSEVKSTLRIPVAMKLSPYFSSLFDVAQRLDHAGADALVLFNRFYQPDIDLDTLEVTPNLLLSTHYEMRLPLRWIAILYGRLNVSLAATSGIHDGQSAIKMIMAGADVTMLCSELLRRGPGRLAEIEKEMVAWMDEHGYDSIDMMKGSMSQRSCAEPAAFERANYMKTLQSYDRYRAV